MAYYDVKSISRFESKINKTESCWLWHAAKYTTGYGMFKFRGKVVQAHRFSYSIYRGRVGDSLVLHTCDNKLCVNPQHLYLGTHKDNMRDVVSRKRMALQTTPRRGSSNPNSKLDEDDVQQIKALIAVGHTNKYIAFAYGVHHSTISCIRCNKSWTII